MALSCVGLHFLSYDTCFSPCLCLRKIFAREEQTKTKLVILGKSCKPNLIMLHPRGFSRPVNSTKQSVLHVLMSVDRLKTKRVSYRRKFMPVSIRKRSKPFNIALHYRACSSLNLRQLLAKFRDYEFGDHLIRWQSNSTSKRNFT